MKQYYEFTTHEDNGIKEKEVDYRVALGEQSSMAPLTVQVWGEKQ